MITLLGVGHVFNIGPRIREEVENRRPDIVCLELDENRFRALKSTGRHHSGPPLYNLVGYFQYRIAKRFGAQVGEEMLAAYDSASELGIPVEFIDRDSGVTWMRMRAAMSRFEAVRLFFSVLGSAFMRRSRVERELSRYREDYQGFMKEFGRGYPSLKRVLVDERNLYMAERLKAIQKQYGQVLAIVGDGHIEGLKAHLADEPISVVRLWELQRLSLADGEDG